MDPKTLLTAILKLPALLPAVDDGVSRLRGKLTRADRERLVKFVRRLDERRVFFHPYGVEVVEVCVGSLDQVKEFTDEVHAAVEHDGARAALGVILDATRTFVERWKGSSTPRQSPWRDGPPWERSAGPHSAGSRSLEGFFQDLGELRGIVRLMLTLLQEIDPKLSAPNLFAGSEV